MPRITQPHDAAWSADVEAAVATFGNRARNEILRFLASSGPATRGDIVAAVSAGDPSVAKHLAALEEAGVVMVDVRPPAFSKQSAAALPKETAGEPDGLHQARADADFEKDPSRNPEGLDLIKSAAQAEASPGFGDRPLAVLTAGDRVAVTEGLPAAVAKDLDSIWMKLQTGLVALSSNGRQEIVQGATHDMPAEKPDVIVKAIQEVLAEPAG